MRKTIDEVRNDALQVLEVLKICPEFVLAGLSREGLEAECRALDELRSRLLASEKTTQELKLQLESRQAGLRESCIRAKLGIQAHYGRNSNEYDLVGGTRLMDRRAPVRKSAAGALQQ